MEMIGRRNLLCAAAAAAAVPNWSLAGRQVLRAGKASLQILPQGTPPTELLGFNGSSPGPELRFLQGDTVEIRFENHTDQPSALHWHGIRLENAMDGVPGLTQDLVQPGAAFEYRFRVPDAGTFWYHSHHRSYEQVARGLYGPLIVEEPNPPEVDADITVMVHDWRLDENGALMGGFENLHDFAHAGRLGNFAMILPSRETVRQGDRVRLRLVNTATARVFPIRLDGIRGSIVALDGMPLPVPRDIAEIQLAPAQRADIIADIVGTIDFLFVTRNAVFEMGSLRVEGENPNPASGAIGPLTASGVPVPGNLPGRLLTLKMEGGAMGGRHAGDDIWAFNGVSGLTQAPFASFERGETATIELINDTAFPHGIHLHGHHFFELTGQGALGDLRDTVLLQRGESRKIAAVFDNPGKWLLHCHMLGHQASGMKTWVEVA